MTCADCGHPQHRHDPWPGGLCAECDFALIARDGSTAKVLYGEPDPRCKGYRVEAHDAN